MKQAVMSTAQYTLLDSSSAMSSGSTPDASGLWGALARSTCAGDAGAGACAEGGRVVGRSSGPGLYLRAALPDLRCIPQPAATGCLQYTPASARAPCW
jgi:hypothetical protein